MYLFTEQIKRIQNKIEKLIFNMNKNLSQFSIENGIAEANYPMLFKGIWTGVLISLIVHQFINH
tara:strand:+ start:423 stop:614 length:192 start_codon:yes stop_codon:yes gene_type:complete